MADLAGSLTTTAAAHGQLGEQVAAAVVPLPQGPTGGILKREITPPEGTP